VNGGQVEPVGDLRRGRAELQVRVEQVEVALALLGSLDRVVSVQLADDGRFADGRGRRGGRQQAARNG
jgi:hypothetical protein